MKDHNLTKHLSTRVHPDTHKKFVQVAQRFGRPSDVLRSLVESFLKSNARSSQK